MTDLIVEPCGPVLGAEIRGLHLGPEGPDAETGKRLRSLLNAHKVLFFRDLDLSHAQHLGIGRVWGPLEGHPVIAHVPGHPEILDIRGSEGRVTDAEGDRRFRAADKWHADVTFRAEPSMGAVLRARQLAPPGHGDTLWVDAAAAYDGLDDAVKARIEGLTATHDLLHDFGDRIAPERRERMAAEFPPQHHPVVRTHPETGARVLFVNSSFTSRIDGLDPTESRDLLRHLLDQFRVPEYQHRFRWTPDAWRSGTIARPSIIRWQIIGPPPATWSASRSGATGRSDTSRRPALLRRRQSHPAARSVSPARASTQRASPARVSRFQKGASVFSRSIR